ncbi:MAG: FixH family protein [Saprospiraceae bacterium]
MKFNWGTGIFLFYGIFAATLFFAVYRSTKYDHSLVVENYYEEDLNYQSRFDQIQNSRSLEAGLVIQLDRKEKMISLDFPKDKKGISGEILLYRADNKKLDQHIPIQLNAENTMLIPTKDILMGRWKMEVVWETGGQSYFDKRVLNIPAA